MLNFWELEHLYTTNKWRKKFLYYSYTENEKIEKHMMCITRIIKFIQQFNEFEIYLPITDIWWTPLYSTAVFNSRKYIIQ